MIEIPRIYRRFIPQLLHMIVLPVFFFTFMLVYDPFSASEFFSTEWFAVHVTIISTILFAGIVLSRLLYYFLPLKLNYTLYSFWCLAEVVFVSFFAALYVWLVLGRPMPYFGVFAQLFKYISMSSVFPYLVLALSMRIFEYGQRDRSGDESEKQKMRFYDERHNLKIVLPAQSILYIQADFNYVNIYYVEGGKLRNYVLRNSMKAIDALCQENGLLRCQRSYYVNPQHVTVLRKEKEGVIYAQLDVDQAQHIPVTKKYYEKLAEMLY